MSAEAMSDSLEMQEEDNSLQSVEEDTNLCDDKSISLRIKLQGGLISDESPLEKSVESNISRSSPGNPTIKKCKRSYCLALCFSGVLVMLLLGIYGAGLAALYSKMQELDKNMNAEINNLQREQNWIKSWVHVLNDSCFAGLNTTEFIKVVIEQLNCSIMHNSRRYRAESVQR